MRKPVPSPADGWFFAHLTAPPAPSAESAPAPTPVTSRTAKKVSGYNGQARRHATASKGASAVLEALRAAHPSAVATSALIEASGSHRAQARLVELRKLGWSIETTDAGSEAAYRLVSLTKGPATTKAVGITVTDGSDGLQARVHADCDGTIDPKVLQDLADEIAQLIRRRVGSR